MRPTRWPLLVALVVVAGVASYELTHAYYADVQSPPVYAPVWLLLLAIAEGYTAYTTNARLVGQPRTRPISPLVVARIAALAKATSPVGALATGAYAGFLADVATTSGPQAHSDTRTAIVGVVCSVALVAAALVLERVCRAKPPDDDHD
jgi:Protein of unknown function (DUF3180)